MQYITIQTGKGGYFVQHSNDEGGSGATVAVNAKELVQVIGDALGWDPVAGITFAEPMAEPVCEMASALGCATYNGQPPPAPCVVLEAIGASQPLLIARVGDSICNADGRLHRVKEIRNG